MIGVMDNEVAYIVLNDEECLSYCEYKKDDVKIGSISCTCDCKYNMPLLKDRSGPFNGFEYSFYCDKHNVTFKRVDISEEG